MTRLTKPRNEFRFPVHLHTLALLFTLSFLALVTAQSVLAAPGDFLFQWGSRYHFYAPNQSPTDDSIGPHGIAIDGGGNVYVVDTGYGQIQVFTSNGDLLKIIGGDGGNSQLGGPQNVAVDSAGNIYVADTGKARIAIFDHNGVYQKAITAVAPGQLLVQPRGVAVDSGGKVYVADIGLGSVYAYSADGSSLGRVDNLTINQSAALAVDAHDNLYAVTGNSIAVYSSNGELLRTIGSGGKGIGQFTSARALAVDEKGDVYIADTWMHRIVVYAATGQFLRNIGYVNPNGYIYGSENGQLCFPKGVAVAKDGTVYVGDSTNGRVQLFSGEGVFIAKWSNYGSGKGEFNRPHGLSVSSSGIVLVSDSNNHRIQSFYPNGQYLAQAGRYGNGQWDLVFPLDVATDAHGNMYVVDTDKKISIFDPAGGFIKSIAIGDRAAESIALYKNGKIYVSVGINIMVLNQRGTFVKTFTAPPEGAPFRAMGLSFDRKGNVYVADWTNSRILVYSCDGDYLRSIGSYGTEDGKLNRPADVAVDAAGNIYVADTLNYRIQVFNNDGTFLGKWGRVGQGAGEFGRPDETESQGPFDGPDGVAVDAAGTVVYVADTFNHRIQAFAGYGVTRLDISAPASTTAGVPIKFTVTALDDRGSKVSGYEGTVRFRSSDPAAALPPESDLHNGTGTFMAIFMTPGQQTITAADTTAGLLTGSSNAITVSSKRHPDLAIAMSHKGTFKEGGRGSYSITVRNVGTATTHGQVTVKEKLPSSITIVSMEGSGWSCKVKDRTCTTSTPLKEGGSYPPITVRVEVARRGPHLVTNEATVIGGGEVNASNSKVADPTIIVRGGQ